MNEPRSNKTHKKIFRGQAGKSPLPGPDVRHCSDTDNIRKFLLVLSELMVLYALVPQRRWLIWGRGNRTSAKLKFHFMVHPRWTDRPTG